MREIKLIAYFSNTKQKTYILKTNFNIKSKVIGTGESIGKVDYNGQELFTNDLVVIKNKFITKEFLIVYDKQQLAYGFQRTDTKTFYTLKEINSIFEKNYTITKIGTVFQSS